MSEYAWRTGGAPSGTSAMFVPINTKARVDELIQGIIVQSGNDACIAVAEALGGTEQGFAKMMEEEARRIGLSKSTFRNSTGLHDPEHLMTARELALLARHIIREHPEQYKTSPSANSPIASTSSITATRFWATTRSAWMVSRQVTRRKRDTASSSRH